MLKKLQLSLLLVLSGAMAMATPVSKGTARAAAVNWYMHYTTSTSGDYSIADSMEATYTGLPTFYTYIFNAGGFVMVSADDAVYPIIGYSPDEVFDKNHIPSNAQHFFDDYSWQISKIVASGADNSVTAAEWSNVLSNTFDDSRAATAVAPMLTTTWDQTAPYSNLVPAGTPTGCVATAMAQVMKKWNYPTTGTGSHSYVHPTYGTQSANFGTTTYDWANMLNTYSGASTAAQKTAVATLMKHCGVSVDMDYAPAGSGAYTTAVPPALMNYFNYQPGCEVKSRASFATDLLWQNMIFAEMDQGRPCLLAGDNAGTAGSGHEFVCDGYNGANKAHINWGWGGSSNGYFYLTALNPATSNYSSNRAAVIRIRPYSAIVPIADFSVNNTIPAIGAPVDFTDLSLNAPTSWSWTFDGGTPATSTSQNPTGITFATNGYHLVSLTVSNANGTDIKTREHYIKVGGAATVWTKQNSAFASASRGVDEIDIIDANTVWAKAYDGTNPTGYIREFTRTNNGGTTWTPGTIVFTNSTNYGVSNIHAMSYTTAYACMFPLSGTGGAIVKTTDGGATWAVQTTAPFTNSWADFVHFFDANNGVCMGDPTATTASDFVIYTTTNGGTTWTQVSTASLPNSLANEAGIVNEYKAVGNTIWFSTNKGRIYKSTNKGVTWTVTTTGLSNSYHLEFKDANTGIIVLDTIPYTVRKTTDGGSTWSTITPTGYFVQRPQLGFVPGTASTWFDVASYPSNGSSKSTDDCATFVNVDTGSVQFLSVAFLDATTGWAGSFNLNSTDGGIYKWNPNPPIVATTSNTNVSCFGGSNGTATVTASGGTPPYTYSWAPSGGTGATATGLAAGSYTVTITGGSTNTQVITITQPSALAASISSTGNVLCFGGTTGTATATSTGGTGSATYSWAPTGGTAAAASGLAAGTYTVTVTDANSCATTATATVAGPSAPLVATAMPTTNVLCFGATTGVATAASTGGTGSATYSWAPTGGTAAAATGLAAGTYTVTVTDANSCATTATTTITEPSSALVATASSVNATCNGNADGQATAIGAGGTAGYTYLWTPGGQTTPTVAGLTAGTYNVNITDANGCNFSTSTTVAEPTAITTTTSATDETLPANGTASAMVTGGTGAYTYSWAPTGGTGATATGLVAGTYTVTITDANGCSDVQTVVVNNMLATGIVGADFASSIKVYPNPSTGVFALSINAVENGNYNVTVVNAIGQVVYNSNLQVNQGNNVYPVSLENLNNGLYTIRITSNAGTVKTTLSKINE